MCGRYSFSHSKDKIEKRFGIKVEEPWKPRYNIAPTQEMPVVTNKNPKEFSIFKWGFIPNWSLDESVAANLINARSETVFTKAPFKHAIKEQRCLIPADGYFEWKKEGKLKVPYRITLNSDDAFTFAGIWDSWERPSDGEIINTYTILTTSSNKLLREIHERMPVILSKDLEKYWLDNKLSDTDINELMKPFDQDQMNFYKVNKIVNSTGYDIPECIQVAPKIYPGESFSLFD
jgi:putative SOS response-associated peptidase YedK